MKEDKKKERGEVSRRDFLVGAGAVVVGGAIGAGITYPLVAGKGDGEVVTTTKTVSVPTTVTTTVMDGATATVTDTVTTTVGDGATVTKTVTSTTTVGDGVEPAPVETSVYCLDWLGFPYANTCFVDHRDGKIIRIRPIHYDAAYDEEEFNPNDAWTIEARGKVFRPFMKGLVPPLSLAYKNRVYSPNRVRYPLKRVDWDPDGDRNIQNRGKSKFKRISWDEATSIIASEIQRIQQTYGPEAIYCSDFTHHEAKQIHGQSKHRRLLDLMYPGGYTGEIRQPDSWEGWYWGAVHMWGPQMHGKAANTYYWFPEMLRTGEMILLWGSDPETTVWGWTGQWNSVFYYWCSSVGIKLVHVAPDLNYANAAHPDKWIPILPGTDVCMHLAIAYTWITEDTYNKDYVDTHTYGFDDFKSYVMGDEDGVPKTPKWAEEKCNVPSYTIKALAREWAAKKTSTSHSNGGGMIRGPYSTEHARGEVALLAMQGFGEPGRYQLTHIESDFEQSSVAWGSVAYLNIRAAGLPPAGYQNQECAKTMAPQCMNGESFSWWGLGPGWRGDRQTQYVKHDYPVPGLPLIHMVWLDYACFTTCWNGGNTWIKGITTNEDIEFVVCQHMWMEDDCYYADIILPIKTLLELDDLGLDTHSGQFSVLVCSKKAADTVGESLSDTEAQAAIAKAISNDLYMQFTLNEKSVLDHMKDGFTGSGASELVSWETFYENGYYVIPLDPNWKDDWEANLGWKDWYEDPDNNPLDTPSGKIEFYCQALAEHFPDDLERPPVLHWIPGGPGWFHDESREGERFNDYPLLLVTNHPRWRVHAEHDDMTWLREIPTCKVMGPDGYNYEPVWVHPTDAAPRGIESGDIVKIFNERGAVLGGAMVCERIIPGAIYQDHGARLDEIIPGQLDRGGANNLICPLNITSPHAPGEVTNSYLVELEKVTLDQMQAWKKQYPDAFARPYDPAAGLRVEGWLEGGL